MISRRTKEALAAREVQGVTLGKPKGTIQDSIYDKDRDRERIVELLQLGVSTRHISTKHLGYGTPSSLNNPSGPAICGPWQRPRERDT